MAVAGDALAISGSFLKKKNSKKQELLAHLNNELSGNLCIKKALKN